MSVQERIRALNIHNNSISGGNTNVGDDILSSSSRRSSPPRGDTSSLSNDTKGDLQSSKSPSTKSSESKSHLFKAAKLINKSFDTETDIAQQVTSSPRSAKSDGESNTQDVSKKIGGGDDSNEDEEELDASAALKFWHTKGTTSTGPRSYKDVLKQSKKSSTTNYGETSEQGRDISSEQLQSEEDGEGNKPPSPPDIVRTANTSSNIDQHDTDEMSTAKNRSTTILEDMPSPTKSIGSTSSSGHVRSSSLPYQAYARRSRLRSPRGDEQSVASVSSQATSGSTLSARALSKIRDKRKDKQKGDKVSAASKVSNHNTLLEKAKVSKDRMKQRAAKNDGEETKIKTDSPFDEQNKPQTIDLRPSMPIISSGHTTISGLNSDVVDPQKYYTHTMDAPQNETAISTVPIKSELKEFSQKTSVGTTASLASTLEDESTNVTSVLASTEESSTNYSELKATDLFDIARQHKNDIQIKPHQSANPANTILESPELNAFPIEGCNILEQLNASLESACSALGSATQARNKMFNREERGLCNKDAPSDEDVAIEVELDSC